MNNGGSNETIKREEIIKECLLNAWETSSLEEICTALETVETIKRFYHRCFHQYIEQCKFLSKCSPPYSVGDFHVNDAGFQFKWKDHTRIFRLECLNWGEVRKRCRIWIKEKEAPL